MKRLKLNLENCYGIRHLTATIDFKGKRSVAIYAPNGVMKTSFARTFLDISQGFETTDHMFPERPTVRVVTDETGAEVSGQDVVVVPSYDEDFGPTESTSTLLIDPALRTEYETLQATIEAAKAQLISVLRLQAGTKRDVGVEVSSAFTKDIDSFFTAITRVAEEVDALETPMFANVPYDIVFDDKVLTMFQAPGFKDALAEYVTQFNKLLEESAYFGKDAFNFWHAANVAKSLADNGFFKASHSIHLNGGTAVEIEDEKELAQLIADEKAKIQADAELTKKFEAIEKLLNKNEQCRKFLEYVSERVELLPEMSNIEAFREKVWISYFAENKELFDIAVAAFRGARTRKREIETEATAQQTRWEKVIETFNERFFVPFRLVAKNRERVMLGQEPVLRLGFEFGDGIDTASVDRAALLDVLSTGEKKALYILNILFEVETRRSSGQSTLFVVDDLADSFDYKNKYAIIQYLKDISAEEDFKLVILTHNFDFYRTLESRFVGYSNCLMAQRATDGITLVQAEGIKNPFINDWKAKFFESPIKRYASIPFIRNILEYTKGPTDADYDVLTSLLHWKGGSSAILQHDLDVIFSSTFGLAGDWPTADESVVDAILREADECLTADAGINFENKIVLSIATRLLAEQFMLRALADEEEATDIEANQTARLLADYMKSDKADADAAKILEGVVLMTPENIHVNSFMYEPILDMSDEHLRRLYAEVKAL